MSLRSCMKLMIGAVIFTLFYSVGMWIKQWLNIPLPANIIGLLLLVAALFAKVIKLSWIEDCGRIALKHMGLFFIPSIVGTLAFAKLMAPQWLPILTSIVAGTWLVMLVTGLVTKYSARKERSTDESRTLAQ